MYKVEIIKYGIITLENCVRSIFDSHQGCQNSTDNQYLYIFRDVNNGELYALTELGHALSLSFGFKLSNGEGIFHGEEVRAMTPYEERLWNEGILPDYNVDLWGNVRVENSTEEYEETLEKYYMFANNFADYIMYNPSATESEFRAWKKLWNWVNVEDNDISDDNKVCFIAWLEENWNGFLKTVLEREYKYMNISEMILNDWEKF